MLEILSVRKHHVGRESMHNVSEVRPPSIVSSYNIHWAYSTGQVPSHTFLLIGRFLQFCIRLVPEMKPCEIRKNGRWTQRYCVSNVSTTIVT